MFYEMCYSFQNNKGNYGSDLYFMGVIEGIVMYMEFVVGYGVGVKVKGGNWFDGYYIMVYFFVWIDVIQCKNFVNFLNQRMGLLDWNDVFFVNFIGKDVDILWILYQ